MAGNRHVSDSRRGINRPLSHCDIIHYWQEWTQSPVLPFTSTPPQHHAASGLRMSENFYIIISRVLICMQGVFRCPWRKLWRGLDLQDSRLLLEMKGAHTGGDLFVFTLCCFSFGQTAIRPIWMATGIFRISNAARKDAWFKVWPWKYHLYSYLSSI